MASIDIKAQKVELTDVTMKYVTKCIDGLDRYIPREDRDDVRAQVLLKRVNRAHGNKYEVLVSLTVVDTTFEASDSTLNVLAALDIVIAKLIADLKNEYAQRLPQQ